MFLGRLFLLFCLIAGALPAYAVSFKEASQIIESHPAVQAIQKESQALKLLGQHHQTWQDPSLKIAAKNLPKKSMSWDDSPMTGFEITLSQKIPLSQKLHDAGLSKDLMGQSRHWQAMEQQEELKHQLWRYAIHTRRLHDQISIVRDNISWITKKIAVSKKLYANGTLSQQAILELQIRQAEYRASLSNKMHELKGQRAKLGFILGMEAEPLDLSSVPWEVLDLPSTQADSKNFREQSLEAGVAARSSHLQSTEGDQIPDLTVSLGYLKRSDMDGKGDFITIGAAFPLPVTGRTDDLIQEATMAKHSAELHLDHYRLQKASRLSQLKLDLEKHRAELKILAQDSLRFAENSREIVSRSYGLGHATYAELLQSELRLTKLRQLKIKLEADISLKKLETKLLLGDQLHE